MSRPTSFLALLQTMLVVIGFFALGAVLKVCGYPDALGLRWNPLAVFLREHGMWLLLLPVLWVSFATSAERLGRGFFSYRLAWIIGLCIAGLTILLFLYAAFFPYTHPIFIFQAR